MWPPLAIWEYVSRQASLMWAGLVTPILIALDAAYLANMEHARNQWKQLFACPIPRWGVYAVKNCFCGLLVMASFAFFSIGLVALALSVGSLRGVNLVSAIPWTGFLVAMSKACVASWLAIVIQSWLSARLPGFIAPVGIGLAAMIVGIILTNHHMGGWFPWSLPSCSLPQGGYGPVPLAPLLGSVGGLALGVLSCWDLNRRAIV